MTLVRFDSGTHSTASQAAKADSSSDLLTPQPITEGIQVLAGSGPFPGFLSS